MDEDFYENNCGLCGSVAATRVSESGDGQKKDAVSIDTASGMFRRTWLSHNCGTACNFSFIMKRSRLRLITLKLTIQHFV